LQLDDSGRTLQGFTFKWKYFMSNFSINPDSNLCDTFGAPCKALCINNIAIFRVIKIPTLKMA